jgi:hypothetical protein
MNPLESLNENDKNIAIRMLKIMGKSGEPNEEDMRYLMNHASPMLEIMKTVFHKRLVDLGVDSDESMAMVTTLAQMGTVAGGISFYDFSVTEKLAEDL